MGRSIIKWFKLLPSDGRFAIGLVVIVKLAIIYAVWILPSLTHYEIVKVGTIQEKFVTSNSSGEPRYYILTQIREYQVTSDQYLKLEEGDDYYIEKKVWN